MLYLAPFLHRMPLEAVLLKQVTGLLWIANLNRVTVHIYILVRTLYTACSSIPSQLHRRPLPHQIQKAEPTSLVVLSARDVDLGKAAQGKGSAWREMDPSAVANVNYEKSQTQVMRKENVRVPRFFHPSWLMRRPKKHSIFRSRKLEIETGIFKRLQGYSQWIAYSYISADVQHTAGEQGKWSDSIDIYKLGRYWQTQRRSISESIAEWARFNSQQTPEAHSDCRACWRRSLKSYVRL
jgi:hypothetical protein